MKYRIINLLLEFLRGHSVYMRLHFADNMNGMYVSGYDNDQKFCGKILVVIH